MADFWFQHLAATLAERGLIAYQWAVADDRFQWAGDLYDAFGLQASEYPADTAGFYKLFNPQHIPQRMASLHDLLSQPAQAGPVPFSARYNIRHAGGAQIDVEESAILQSDPATGKKTLSGFLKVKPRETAAVTIQPRAATVSINDGSMNHFGRRAVQHRIEEWIETGGRAQNASGYLLVIGIDRLSMMNEAFGARYTDELIDRTGARLRQIAGANGFSARIDGDVFGLFFPQAHVTEMAAAARYILNNFYNTPLETSKGPVGVSVSIGGLPVSAGTCRDVASVVTKAEMAMQTAKNRGRGCFVSYDEAAEQAIDNRVLIESGDEFLRAMKDNRVRLAFQPVMGAISEEVTFHECLIRMLDHDGKLVSAGDFIPAVEKLGLSRLVDQYAMRTAIQELSQFPELSLSVNVSNMTLTNPDWLRGVVNSLRDRPSVANRLIIEITESAVINDMRQTIRVAKTLKELGCRVALDDFGAGYTAFSQIKDMEVDIVKIDKSFVRNMDDAQNHLFIRTLQSLAHGVNVETVGEGAETMADARQLVTHGIDHIQGYVYGFPRVERVWLPKDHIYRMIPLAEQKKAPGKIISAAHEAIIADVASFQHG